MKRAVEEILKFNEERDWDQFHSPENLAKSISIEAGELLECFQWNNEYDLEEVKEELADVINYCILMADKLGVDPKQIVLDKMEKTAKINEVKKENKITTIHEPALYVCKNPYCYGSYLIVEGKKSMDILKESYEEVSRRI